MLISVWTDGRTSVREDHTVEPRTKGKPHCWAPGYHNERETQEGGGCGKVDHRPPGLRKEKERNRQPGIFRMKHTPTRPSISDPSQLFNQSWLSGRWRKPHAILKCRWILTNVPDFLSFFFYIFFFLFYVTPLKKHKMQNREDKKEKRNRRRARKKSGFWWCSYNIPSDRWACFETSTHQGEGGGGAPAVNECTGPLASW